uniref:Uncharacterized protein n=1 Tax=Pseudo-nitzschia australis TaxID=44445 RepID=A0A6V0BE74_9STRA
MMFFCVSQCLLAQRNGCLDVAVVVFLLLVVTPNLEGCHGDNDLDSRRVNIVVDDKGLLKEMNKQTNKHELNCNQRNKCNGSNQKIDTYIVTVADMVDIALASCPTWLCCLLLANSS